MIEEGTCQSVLITYVFMLRDRYTSTHLRCLLVQRRIRRRKDREHQESHSVLGSNRLTTIQLDCRKRIGATCITTAAFVQGQRRAEEDSTGRGESGDSGETDPPGKPDPGSIRECADAKEQQFQSIRESSVSSGGALLIGYAWEKGKFIRILFQSDGTISGANVDWYLLEKSRVTDRNAGERNFHVFYQLLASGSKGKEIRGMQAVSA